MFRLSLSQYWPSLLFHDLSSDFKHEQHNVWH